MLQFPTSACRESRADLEGRVWAGLSGATASWTVLTGRTRLTAVRMHCPHYWSVISLASGIISTYASVSLAVRFHGTSFVLQIYSSQNQTWLPVCADNWSDQHTKVACRQMGYRRFVAPLLFIASVWWLSRCRFNGASTRPYVAICGEPADGNVHLENGAWLTK